MSKPTKNTLFPQHGTKPETPMDKTTRIVRKIVDDEAEERQVKNTRLRIARLEREANTPVAPAKKPARKPTRAKAGTRQK